MPRVIAAVILLVALVLLAWRQAPERFAAFGRAVESSARIVSRFLPDWRTISLRSLVAALASACACAILLPRVVFGLLATFLEPMYLIGAPTKETTSGFDALLSPFSGLGMSGFFSWLGTWLLLEIRGVPQRRRLLSHLRYGPAVALVAVAGLVTAADMVGVARSRAAIGRYIRGTSSPDLRPALELYNDYRGHDATRAKERLCELYGRTATEALSDADPAVRGRSVQAALAVACPRGSWREDSCNAWYLAFHKQVTADRDPRVRYVYDRGTPGSSVAYQPRPANLPSW